MILRHSGPHCPRYDDAPDRPFQCQECQERLGSLRDQHAHPFLVEPEPADHGDAKMRPVLPIGVSPHRFRHDGRGHDPSLGPPLTRGLVAYQLSTHQRTQASPTRPSSSHVHRRVRLGLDRPGALGAPLPRAAWRAGGLSRANPADQFVGRSVRSPAPSIDGLGAPRFDGSGLSVAGPGRGLMQPTWPRWYRCAGRQTNRCSGTLQGEDPQGTTGCDRVMEDDAGRQTPSLDGTRPGCNPGRWEAPLPPAMQR
jgi:hypothetical protein